MLSCTYNSQFKELQIEASELGTELHTKHTTEATVLHACVRIVFSGIGLVAARQGGKIS